MYVNTPFMGNFGFENRIHWPSQRPFWVVYEDLSIDFGRTVLLQNRNMACTIGCGLFLSLQQQRDASSEMSTVYSLSWRGHCSVTMHQEFREKICRHEYYRPRYTSLTASPIPKRAANLRRVFYHSSLAAGRPCVLSCSLSSLSPSFPFDRKLTSGCWRRCLCIFANSIPLFDASQCSAYTSCILKITGKLMLFVFFCFESHWFAR